MRKPNSEKRKANLTRPAGVHENLCSFARIARGGRDDGSLADQNLPAFLRGEADVFFADEFFGLGWWPAFAAFGRLRCGRTDAWASVGARQTPCRQESIDTARQAIGGNILGRWLGGNFRQRRQGGRRFS